MATVVSTALGARDRGPERGPHALSPRVKPPLPVSVWGGAVCTRGDGGPVSQCRHAKSLRRARKFMQRQCRPHRNKTGERWEKAAAAAERSIPGSNQDGARACDAGSSIRFHHNSLCVSPVVPVASGMGPVSSGLGWDFLFRQTRVCPTHPLPELCPRTRRELKQEKAQEPSKVTQPRGGARFHLIPAQRPVLSSPMADT